MKTQPVNFLFQDAFHKSSSKRQKSKTTPQGNTHWWHVMDYDSLRVELWVYPCL